MEDIGNLGKGGKRRRMQSMQMTHVDRGSLSINHELASQTHHQMPMQYPVEPCVRCHCGDYRIILCTQNI